MKVPSQIRFMSTFILRKVVELKNNYTVRRVALSEKVP